MPSVPIDNVDQDLENGIEAGYNLSRRPAARCFCEAANVNEHDADPSHFAELGGADGGEKALDHTWRDVLTEQVGHSVAGGGGRAPARSGS